MADLASRIGRVARPTRIVLFGSAARGQIGPNSDPDVLVVMPDGIHRRETARRIYRALRGLGIPKDVVVVTESDVERFGDGSLAGDPRCLVRGQGGLPWRLIVPSRVRQATGWPTPNATSSWPVCRCRRGGEIGSDPEGYRGPVRCPSDVALQPVKDGG